MSYAIVTNLIINDNQLCALTMLTCAPAGHASAEACLESSPIIRPIEWSSILQSERFTLSSILLTFSRTNERKYPTDKQSSGLNVTPLRDISPFSLEMILVYNNSDLANLSLKEACYGTEQRKHGRLVISEITTCDDVTNTSIG